MAFTRKGSNRTPITSQVTLATADDLNGTVDNTQAFDVSGYDRVLIVQDNTGTNGTAGIDVVEYSKDGGVTWAAASDVLALASDDAEGTFLVGGALNAAGTEPSRYAVFKAGPFSGKTAIRIARGGSGASGTPWVTGAPAVNLIAIGGRVAAPSALA